MNYKYLANSISIIRIFLSASLLFMYKNTSLFIAVYLICGLSDVLDGYIARKTNTQSIIGAKIDSAADFVMFIVITITIIRWLGHEIFPLLPLLIAVILIRVINLIYSKFKYGTYVFIHTYANKITGLLVFAVPVVYVISRNNAALVFVCIVSIISAVEEGIINILSKEADLNRTSIFQTKI